MRDKYPLESHSLFLWLTSCFSVKTGKNKKRSILATFYPACVLSCGKRSEYLSWVIFSSLYQWKSVTHYDDKYIESWFIKDCHSHGSRMNKDRNVHSISLWMIKEPRRNKISLQNNICFRAEREHQLNHKTTRSGSKIFF